MALSLTTILSTLSVGYVCFSMCQLWSIFDIPPCDQFLNCLDYYLRTNPKVDLAVWTGTNKRPLNEGDLHFLKAIHNFNYTLEMETILKVPLPRVTRKNGSLYMFVYLLQNDPNNRKLSLYNRHVLSAFVYPLTKHIVPSVSAFDLLSDETIGKYPNQPVTHVKKEIHFKIVTELDEVPSIMIQRDFEGIARLQGEKTLLPLMYYDSCRDQYNNLILLENQTVVDVTLKYSPVGLGKFRFMVFAERALGSIKEYGLSDKELDPFKSMFSDANKIYLFCITVIMATLHLLLDILALKNEVSFWRTRTTLVGLSKTTVIWRAFSQLIIVLFLYEKMASMLVTIPAFFSLSIEFWKVLKVWKFKLKNQQNNALFVAENKSSAIDSTGMLNLLYVVFPLWIGTAFFSLVYELHNSWYSWALSSLVNGVYSFGFLFMLPQLFLNYKLKSVAQLPWRSFMYKAFNTFVDDMFAFLIETPTAHRVACFRDDFVFLVYLYQRWLYPVDANRRDNNLSFEESPDGIGDFTEGPTKKLN